MHPSLRKLSPVTKYWGCNFKTSSCLCKSVSRHVYNNTSIKRQPAAIVWGLLADTWCFEDAWALRRCGSRSQMLLIAALQRICKRRYGTNRFSLSLLLRLRVASICSGLPLTVPPISISIVCSVLYSGLQEAVRAYPTLRCESPSYCGDHQSTSKILPLSGCNAILCPFTA